MRRYIILVFLIIAAQPLAAQNNNDISGQIDKQVWEPFKTSYASGDGEKYNSLHTDDVLRITDSGIRQGSDYKNDILKWFGKPDRTERTIDFRFEQRMHSDSIAYEVGYYKVVYFKDGVKDRTSYGRFHVVLKKINRIWKISQDWDTNSINGIKITAEDFEKAGH